MNRRRDRVASTCRIAVMAALTLAAGAAFGQAAGPSAPATPATTGPRPARPAIQLSPVERQAIDESQQRGDKPARVEDALAPTADDMKPRAEGDQNATRIEQHRVSNRVSEVVVTPAGQSRSYVMTNREGQQPFGTTQMNSGGLSVPMFFRFEFGRSATPPPTTNPPPPPAPSPSR